MRVIVTEDAPAPGVLAAVRGLRAHGYEPWVGVTSRGSYGARSRACGGAIMLPDPRSSGKVYALELAAAAARLRASVVLPGTESALVALAAESGAFDATTTVGVGPPGSVRVATDKFELARLAAMSGLETIPTRSITLTELDSADLGLPFPAVVKPPRTATTTGRGAIVTAPARRVKNLTGLREVMESRPGARWLVQPYVVGSLGAICGVAWGGELVCASHQLAKRIYPPDCGVSAYAVTVARDVERERRVAALMAGLRWSGLFQAQFLHTPQGSYLIDLNPRIFGSLALSIGAGLNLPAIWTDLLLGREPTSSDYRVGVWFRSEERDAAALVAACGARRWRLALSVLAPRRPTVHALFKLSDPAPALSGLRRLAKVREVLARTVGRLPST